MRNSSPLAKLVAGLMYPGEDEYERAVKVLKAEFGAIEAESDAFPFDFTDYYAREMDPGLKKRFLCFRGIVARGGR